MIITKNITNDYVKIAVENSDYIIKMEKYVHINKVQYFTYSFLDDKF